VCSSDLFVAAKFNLKGPRPLITVQTKGRQKDTLGWHWKEKWQLNKEEISEINICAESLNKDPIETLVHEIAHHANAINKIEDCNIHQYHNKHFKTKAESYGLNVEKSGRHGWSHTSLSDELKKTLKEAKINYKVFELYRKENRILTAPTKMRKFNCGCTIVRCAKDLKAKCLICGKEFAEE
jgi:hypothetical protein